MALARLMMRTSNLQILKLELHMNISGISASNGINNAASQASSGTKPGGGNSNEELLGKAEAIAREGFELSLKAKQITNKYAAAKEVR